MRRTVRLPQSGAKGKIEDLRSAARRHDAVAAQAVLEVLGYEEDDQSVGSTARAWVGALIIVEVWRELTLIRRIITAALKQRED